MTHDSHVPGLRARPTTYKGIRMRSRLEARYAAHIDSRRVPWQYEPQCFADETGQYLPDFLVTDGPFTTYIEVKPTREAARAALRGPMQIIKASHHHAILMAVWIDTPEGDGLSWRDGEWHSEMDEPSRPSIDSWVTNLTHLGQQPHVENIDGHNLICFTENYLPNPQEHVVCFSRTPLAIRPWPPTLTAEQAEMAAIAHERHPAAFVLIGHDASIAPHMIEVSDAGEVTDAYVGQYWYWPLIGHI